MASCDVRVWTWGSAANRSGFSRGAATGICRLRHPTATRNNAYALSNDGPHGWWTTTVIDHTPASDLVYSVDGSCRIDR